MNYYPTLTVNIIFIYLKKINKLILHKTNYLSIVNKVNKKITYPNILLQNNIFMVILYC